MEEKSNIGFIESCDVPSVYSNKQSYYEVLCYINYKLNEVIDLYNSFEYDYKKYVDSQIGSMKSYADSVSQDAEENANSYTDTRASATLASAKEYTDKAKEKLDSDISEIIANLTLLTTKVTQNTIDITQEIVDRQSEDGKLDTKIETLRNENLAMINTLRGAINANSSTLAVTFDNKLLELKNYIDTHYIETLMIHNPWRGKTTKAQELVNDVFRVYRPLSMSVSEIESVLPEVMSIDEYKALSVGDFDFNGLRVKQYLSDAYVHSMLTGRYVTLHQAYYELAQLLGNVKKDPLSETDNGSVNPASLYNNIKLLDKNALVNIDMSEIDNRLSKDTCYYASMCLYDTLTKQL